MEKLNLPENNGTNAGTNEKEGETAKKPNIIVSAYRKANEFRKDTWEYWTEHPVGVFIYETLKGVALIAGGIFVKDHFFSGNNGNHISAAISDGKIVPDSVTMNDDED